MWERERTRALWSVQSHIFPTSSRWDAGASHSLSSPINTLPARLRGWRRSAASGRRLGRPRGTRCQGLTLDVFHQLRPILEGMRAGDQELSIGKSKDVASALGNVSDFRRDVRREL